MLTSTPVLGAGPAAITPFAGPGVRTCWLFVGLYRQINVNVDVGVNTCMVAR